MEINLLIDETGRVASYSDGEIMSNNLQKITISIKGEEHEQLKQNKITYYINGNFIFIDTPLQIEEKKLKEIEEIKNQILVKKDQGGITTNDIINILDKLIN